MDANSVPLKQDSLALDRGSARTYDVDGHLHVASTNISKAVVNPYLGREIPDNQALGLNPDKTYLLLRDPNELEKAADSFNGKPLLDEHRPVTASDHDHNKVVGSVSNVEFAHPYLKAHLSVWDGDAISDIQNGKQRELSCGYRYRADMTPGTHEGVKYDGVMRDIQGNHVALVKEGRAGPDVFVGDSVLLKPNLKDIFMPKSAVPSRTADVARGALMIYLLPKLAQDAKIDLAPVLKDLTAKNFKVRAPALIKSIGGLTKGKLAADASIEDVKEVIEALADVLPTDAQDDPDASIDPDATDAGDPMDAYIAGLSDEDKAKLRTKLGGAASAAADADETDAEKKKRLEEAEKKVAAKDAEMKNMVTKPAMDAALAKIAKETEARVIKTQREISAAERDVEPRVGRLTIACDSADDVYRAALTVMEVDVADLPGGSCKAVYKAIPAPETVKRHTPIAQDAAASKGFAERYPGAADIRIL